MLKIRQDGKIGKEGALQTMFLRRNCSFPCLLKIFWAHEGHESQQRGQEPKSLEVSECQKCFIYRNYAEKH